MENSIDITSKIDIGGHSGEIDGYQISEWEHRYILKLKGEHSMDITPHSGEMDGHLKVDKSMGTSKCSNRWISEVEVEGPIGDLTVVQSMAFGAQSGDIGKNMLQNIATPRHADW